MSDHEYRALINSNTHERKMNCLSSMFYVIYFLYNAIIFAMLTVNTYYTLHLAENIQNDSNDIENKINSIYDQIQHFINDTFNH